MTDESGRERALIERGTDRRRIERRAAKRGVTVRHDDKYPDETKRVKRARYERKYLR